MIAIAERGLHVVAACVDRFPPEHVQRAKETQRGKHIQQYLPEGHSLAPRRARQTQAEPEKDQRQRKAQISAQPAQNVGKPHQRRDHSPRRQQNHAEHSQRETHAGGDGHVRPF